MTERPDMRFWPFEESEGGGRTLRRVRNGMTDSGVRWAVMGQSGYTPGCNGYAQIPWEGHPWSGCTDYEQLEVEVHGGLTYGPKPEFDFRASIESLIDATKDTDHPLRTGTDGLRVIPETTFAEVGGWIGFDTLHAWDYWPDDELARIGLEFDSRFRFRVEDGNEITWSLERIVHEAQWLANQVAMHGVVAKANRKETDRVRPDKRKRT